MRTYLHRLGVVLAASVSLLACNRSTSQTRHESLSSVDPVRNAFNADSGKVRAIFLASPT
jgi:hypothetical protein